MPDTRSFLSRDVTDEAKRRRQFDTLCTSLRTDLFRFLFWLCNDRTLAEDLTQETFLRAWRSFDSLQDHEAAKPWLLTIARRELARVFERKRLETVDIDTLTETERDTFASSDSRDVEEMRHAIRQLEPGYREPLVLQVLFGYSTEEIAKHMELSLQTVLTRLFRARQQLRRLMLGDVDDEGSLS